MEHWAFLNLVAYGAVGIAALIEACEVALMKAHKIRQKLPKVIANRNWAFVPLILLLVSASIFLIDLLSGSSFVPALGPFTT
jgi:hypothetical protein